MKIKNLLFVAALFAAGCGGGGDKPAGRAVTPGVDLQHKILTIGMLNDESGPVSAIGRPFGIGKRILVAQINAGNSRLLPDGWTVKLVERDHGYNPQRSVQLFNEIRDRVLFIGTSFGTPNTLPLRASLERNRIVAFPASLSSQMAEFTYTPPLAPSYKYELLRGLDWAIEQAGGAAKVKAGLVYQQDDYGQDGLDALTDGARQLSVSVVSTQAYHPGQADFTAVVNALKKAGATHVFLTTVPSATGPILGTAAQLGYHPVWIGNSPSWIDRYFDPGVMPAAVFANYHLVSSLPYWGEDIPVMKRFLAAYERYGKDSSPPDSYILASYLQGLVQIEVFNRALVAGAPTREGYLTALHTLKGYTADGAFPEPMDFSRVPYVTGTRTRVLKPDFGTRGWTVSGGYARPTAKTR